MPGSKRGTLEGIHQSLERPDPDHLARPPCLVRDWLPGQWVDTFVLVRGGPLDDIQLQQTWDDDFARPLFAKLLCNDRVDRIERCSGLELIEPAFLRQDCQKLGPVHSSCRHVIRSFMYLPVLIPVKISFRFVVQRMYITPVFIVQQTLSSRIHRLESVCLRHLGEKW